MRVRLTHPLRSGKAERIDNPGDSEKRCVLKSFWPV